MADRVRYQQADAEALPFPDDTFDLVTCQTGLVHCPRPGAVLAEMLCVARPGGRLLVAEPNNLTGVMLSPHAVSTPIDELVALVGLEARCERGKAELLEGDNSFGEQVPALFAALGVRDVRVCLNDRAVAVLPPYGAPGNRAWIEEAESSFAPQRLKSRFHERGVRPP